MENEANIDKSFKKINNNLWAGTFIGFKDSSHINEFNKVDFQKIYHTSFPNNVAMVFCFFNIFFLFPLCLSLL